MDTSLITSVVVLLVDLGGDPLSPGLGGGLGPGGLPGGLGGGLPGGWQCTFTLKCTACVSGPSSAGVSTSVVSRVGVPTSGIDGVDSSHCMSDHDAIVIVDGDSKAMEYTDTKPCKCKDDDGKIKLRRLVGTPLLLQKLIVLSLWRVLLRTMRLLSGRMR